jgi:hypothetical protein
MGIGWIEKKCTVCKGVGYIEKKSEQLPEEKEVKLERKKPGRKPKNDKA